MPWIPHVALIHFIYYVSFSPQQYADKNVFWMFGTFVRALVGEKTVNAAVKFMWIVHVLEAAYTVILARRYETTFLVGVRLLIHRTKKRKKLTGPLDHQLLYVLAALLFGRPGWEELSNRVQESLVQSTKVA